jgi:SAM-dependent methyltransferase
MDSRARFVASLPKQGHLLDLGCSDGETLSHFLELRPDLHLHAVDLAGPPKQFKSSLDFVQANLETDGLRWPAESMDAITCMQVLEHLHTHDLVFSEISRLLKPNGRAFLETPHPKTADLPRRPPKGNARGFTFNFFDDPAHVKPLSADALTTLSRAHGLEVLRSGISRNCLFALSWPLGYCAAPRSRREHTALTHWIGWSLYVEIVKAQV